MELSTFYVVQAVNGTGQQGKADLDIKKLQEWLIEFAKIARGRKWHNWLNNLGLSTKEEIEAAVVEYLEINGGGIDVRTK